MERFPRDMPTRFPGADERVIESDVALERLYAATAAISAAIDDEAQLLRTVPEEFALLLNVRYGALGLLGEEGGLTEFHTHGLTPEQEEFLRPTPPVGRGILGALLHEGRPLRIGDIEADDRRAGMPVGHPPMRSFLGVPLIASSRVIGRLYATDREDGTFSASDEALAMGFAAAAAVAIESARRTARLVNSERLRAAGELALGISHDFNNILATILGRVEVMLSHARDPEVADGLIAIRRAARDGASIAGRIREFGRAIDLNDFRAVDLRVLAIDAVQFTRPRWDRASSGDQNAPDIDVTFDFVPIPPVDGDPVSIREVLVNLLFNALDALPGGGRIVVGVRPAAGESVLLQVRDSGTGIPVGAQAHVFAPFFTTKGSRGSGLGLAMVRRVMDGHGGSVHFETAPGRGTTFTLTFPAVAVMGPTREDDHLDLPAAPIRQGRPEEVSRRAPSPPSPLSIVLVDDQEDVLEAVAMLIRLDGHAVRTFSDPREAVKSIGATIPDVLITDLSMPEMDGWDLARAAQGAVPGLPVIVLTGLGRTVTQSQSEAHGVALVLTKPPDREGLLAAIASVTASGHRPRPPLCILIVDDSPSFLLILRMLIEQKGHAVVAVSGVADARIQLATMASCDLVLVDAHLADGDAREVVAAAREWHPGVRSCVISGSDLATSRQLVPGADDYAEKTDLSKHLDALIGATWSSRR